MERNDFSGNSAPGQSGGSSAGTGYGAGAGNTGSMGGSTGSTSANTGSMGGGSGSTGDQGISDRARDLAGSAQDKLADVGSTVRDRTGNIKDSLADALTTGADKLRQRAGSGSGQLAGATGSGSTAIDADGRLTQVSGKVAGGMEATADWLRDADLDGIKSGLEQQVKEHPGRTLLIAAGLGYLLGKAFRN